MPRHSWYAYWQEVNERVDADPDVKRAAERVAAVARKAGGRGMPAAVRAESAYLALRAAVRERERLAQAAIEVDRERADKAAYMREYRAKKRSIRQGVDARRSQDT